MAKVVVLGAGIGGITQVYELKQTLGKAHEIVLLGDSDRFEFTPSNPWVAVGWLSSAFVIAVCMFSRSASFARLPGRPSNG